MMRSSSSSLARSAGSTAARTATYTHSHRIARACTSPTAALVPLTPRRTFASTPTPRKRGEPVKLLPEWTWRRAWRTYPVPIVEVVNNADDADAVLETLTSSRLSLDPEPGARPGATSTQRHLGGRHSSSVRDGVLSVADGEGVIVLHLAAMDRFPDELKRILEDDTIEKQILGAGWWLHEIADNPTFYDCEPRNILDLRHLAEWCWPTLADESTRPKHHSGFMTVLAKDFLGLRYAVPSTDDKGYQMRQLQGAKLDVIINQAWFAHCAGAEIRRKLPERIEFKVSRGALPVPAFMRERLVERLVDEVQGRARWSMDEVRRSRERDRDGRGE
ncbi:hypothetical protein JCM8208_003179 [Rhodotorula glutinis]